MYKRRLSVFSGFSMFRMLSLRLDFREILIYLIFLFYGPEAPIRFVKKKKKLDSKRHVFYYLGLPSSGGRHLSSLKPWFSALRWKLDR